MDNVLEFKKESRIYAPRERRAGLFHVCSLGRFCCEEKYCTIRKDYPNFLLLFTQDGGGRLMYEGTSHDLKAGDVFLIDCRKPHVYHTLCPPWKFIYLHFDGEVCQGYCKAVKEGFGVAGPLPAGGRRRFVEIWEEMSLQLEDLMQVNEARISLLICQLLTLLLETEIRECSFQRVLQLVGERYAESITLEDMIQSARMSKYHFIRKFKAETGYTPYGYLTSYRMNQAKIMLCDTARGIGEIACLVGYESQAHFAKKFKEMTGLSPFNFRKIHRMQ
ncbi:MAG TPA: hypothetical protein DD727_01765 [Clostridiales bacterium]|nr:hypothetical protein [Clostridiales bacterium]